MHRTNPILIGLCLLLIAGCSPITLVNRFTDTSGYELRPNIAYGKQPRQRLDIYRPHMSERPAPIVIFIYGGRWREGAREDYRFVAQALTSIGAIAVVPDYGKFPAVQFPDFVSDAALAARWVIDHSAELDGDPRRTFIMGHSAGAQIAALLALDPRYLRAQGLGPTQLRGMIGLAGPYDFFPFTDADVAEVFASVDDLSATQPITYACNSHAPLLLLYGADDTTVKPGNSVRLAERIKSCGGQVTARAYPGIGHIGIIGSLWSPARGLAPTLTDIQRFIDEQ